MGEERKRGKLADLNWLLRLTDPGTQAEARFSLVVGNVAALAGTRYVVTLDTDTQLPRDCGRASSSERLAHPLNRPVFDASGERVCAGYGILQPRVSPSLPGTHRSRYARLHSGEPGIDPYTRTVSDVYQDLFDEGSFIGKGIYDVDAFERVLAGKLPDNRILSHDLLEGGHARSGLLSDVELFEDYPPTYAADAARRYRWIRGDWQIASWALSRVPERGRSTPSQSARLPRPLEDRRQPAPQPRADRVAAAVAGRLDGPVLPARVDGRRARRVRGRTRAEHAAAARAQVERQRLANACAGRPAGCRDPMGAGRARARLPAARGLLECGRDPAHDLAGVRLAASVAAMESVRRPPAQRCHRRWPHHCG